MRDERRKKSPGSFRPVDGEMKRQERPLLGKISGLIERTRRKVAASINHEMVLLYWDIGKAIKEEIMKSKRAEYGEQIVRSLSSQLTQKYGKGFSSPNLWFMVNLHETYPILYALRRECEGLSWTHIRTLLPITLEHEDA